MCLKHTAIAVLDILNSIMKSCWEKKLKLVEIVSSPFSDNGNSLCVFRYRIDL